MGIRIKQHNTIQPLPSYPINLTLQGHITRRFFR